MWAGGLWQRFAIFSRYFDLDQFEQLLVFHDSKIMDHDRLYVRLSLVSLAVLVGGIVLTLTYL